MHVPQAGGGRLDERLLGIYLNDHLAGATAGTALARRSRAGARTPALAAALDVVGPQIAEDRATLLQIMRGLGVPARGYKVAAGRAAELVGRLKPNGHVRERSPLTDLVELDGLLMGVASKESLWRTLQGLSEALGDRAVPGLDELIAGAQAQRQALEEARPPVVREAFAAPSPAGASTA